MFKLRTKWQRLLIAFFGMIVGLGLLSAGIFYLWVSRLDISKIDYPLPKPTLIYDRHEQVVSQLSASKIDPIPLEKIPLHLQNAIIATEDRRFYDHSGVDFQAVARAFVRNLESFGYVEGGSTITQQLCKNLFLTSDKTMLRKLREAAYAIKMEQTISKEEILELYLNQIYFGEGAWGVQKAAHIYFGKDVSKLTLSESAMLAGLPKAPTHYSPVNNKENALKRRNWVLSFMKKQHFISTEQYEEAVKEPLRLKQSDENSLRGKYASYVDYIIQEAIEKYGFTEQQILTGGLKIYTQLDPKVQQSVYDVYQNDSFFPVSAKDQMLQSGMVVIDPYAGAVRGMIGNRGSHVFRGFNHATQMKRQPGSTFKPLSVYSLALEKGYGPNAMLYDGELNINGYAPRDWDRQTRGEVSLREAIVKSWNIPAVWLLNEMGLDESIRFVKRLGIPLTEKDRNLGIALGGLSEGVSPLQMAQAYSMFPNQGTMITAHAITKICTETGHLLVKAEIKPKNMISPSSAYLMTRLLQEAVQSGTGREAASVRPTAGKTGTTQLPKTKRFEQINGSKDAWFVGYTPELVAAVWLGYDNTDENHYLTSTGGHYPARIFREVMARSLSAVTISAFPASDDSPAEQPGAHHGKGKKHKKHKKE